MAFDLKPSKLRHTVPYAFPRLSADPEKPLTLHTRHLGVRNPPAFNAQVKRPLKERDFAEDRRFDIETIAAHCVQSWENVTDGGQPVECTPAKVLELLQAIDAEHPDEIELFRYWVQNLGNFAEPVEEPAALGKE